MAQSHHNPGNPVQLTFPRVTLTAFSISALATYVLAPEFNCAFDMGECPIEAVPLSQVFLSHAHGDHSRCLLRHESLRRLMGMEPATYYIPEETLEGFEGLSRAWHKLENAGSRNFDLPRYHPLKPGDEVWLHRQLMARAFRVDHSLPSLGYTLFDVRKKLLPEFQGRSGRELGDLRRQGVTFEQEIQLPLLTFIGDSTIRTLYQEKSIGESEILLLELTYLLEDEKEMAGRRGHTHLDDLLQFLRDCPDTLNNQHIVLKHFSMRYDRRTIIQTLRSRLPADFLERCHILV